MKIEELSADQKDNLANVVANRGIVVGKAMEFCGYDKMKSDAELKEEAELRLEIAAEEKNKKKSEERANLKSQLKKKMQAEDEEAAKAKKSSPKKAVQKKEEPKKEAESK
ncbi:hypothetical protein COB55_03240 [Candidatus Wolfebacteria bacterium]|nr:MAG: hypothetical protein COB55_03240 [Candidatus Wolfebacteria bacterium]